MAKDSFGARTTLNVGGRKYTIFSLPALEKRGFALARLPYSIKVMLENVLRREDGVIVTADQVEALATLERQGRGEREVLVHAGARAVAGFHRRAGGRGSGRDARRDQAARRRPRRRSIRCSRPIW